MQPEHEHDDLEQLREAYLDALRAWRVGLRIHLEDTHGVLPGADDPETVHSRLHEG